MAEWKTIDKDKPLRPGDRVRLTFTSHGLFWLQATQIAMIEAALEGKEGFSVKSWRIDEATKKIIFVCDVVKTNPVIITCAVIAGAIALSGVTLWLVLDKTEQLIESPVGAALGIGTIVIAGLALYALSKRGT